MGLRFPPAQAGLVSRQVQEGDNHVLGPGLGHHRHEEDIDHEHHREAGGQALDRPDLAA